MNIQHMNIQTLPRSIARLTAIAVAAGGLAFAAGCSQADRDTAKAKTDNAVETVKDKSRELTADAKQAGAEIKADVKDAAADIKARTGEVGADAKREGSELKADGSNAMDNAKVAVADATITTTVKAELAKDPVLKAKDINVDTEAGRVSLRGTAPSKEAKDRATTLANAVSGVVSVRNELTVAANS